MTIKVDYTNLVNPTAASGRGQYYGVDGNTISSSNKPKIDGGAIAGTFGQDPGSALVDGVNTYRVNADIYASVAVTGSDLQRTVVGYSTMGTPVEGEYIIRGVTSKLAGSADYTLRSPGSYIDAHARDIHQRENVWTTRVAQAIRNGDWNPYLGAFSTDPTTADDMSAFETNGVDDAANPTRSVPGELTYRDGSPSPTLDEYSAKYGG